MAWTVRYNGSPISVDDDSIRISQRVDRLDEASFSVTVNSAQTFDNWATIEIDADGVPVFGGYVSGVSTVDESATVRQYRISARGYAMRFYQTHRVRRAWVDATLSQVIADILAEAGIGSEFTSVAVDTNVTIDSLYVQAENAGAALDYVRSWLTGTTGEPWAWRVLPDKTVSFRKYTTRTAGWALERNAGDAAAAGWNGPAKRPSRGELSIDEDDSTIINSVRVIGGERAAAPVTETFTGDGARVKFHVTSYPIADLVWVRVNGADQDVGVDYFDADCPAHDCYVNFETGYVRFCVAPPSGATVEVRYAAYERLEHVAEDSGSISQYGLRFYQDIENASIVTDADAASLAQDILDRFAYGVMKGSGTVELAISELPEAGGRIFVAWGDEGLSGYFSIVQVDLEPAQIGARCTIRFGGRTVRLNDVLAPRSARGEAAYQRPRAPKLYGQMGSVALIEELRVGDAYGFLQGVGKWVGRDVDGIYKEFTGDPSGDHWYWDGSELYVSGKFVGDADIAGTASNTFTINNDLDDATVRLIFGHPDGNAELYWAGSILYSLNTPFRVRASGVVFAIENSNGEAVAQFYDSGSVGLIRPAGDVDFWFRYYRGLDLIIQYDSGDWARGLNLRDSGDSAMFMVGLYGTGQAPNWGYISEMAYNDSWMRFFPGSEKVVQIPTGRLSIGGDTTPDYNLQVNGTTYLAGATFGGAALPDADKTQDVGSTSMRWRSIYADYLNLSGAADIAQDLIVGGGTGVLHVDVSQGNVGINCAPDPQFDLDVAGNLRAQGWIVGEHAIQVDDAIAIMHFDGPAPPETNFHGELVTHMGKSPAVANNLYFMRGRYNKAVVRSVGTYNEFKNPVLGVDASGWHEWWNNQHANGRVTHLRFTGGYAFEIEADADGAPGNAIFAYGDDYRIPCAQGEVFAIQFEALHSGEQAQNIPQITEYDASGNSLNSHSVDTWWVEDLGDSLERVYAVVTVQDANAASFSVIANGPTLNAGEKIWYGAAQVEKATWPTPFFYGDMPGCIWTGTAHDSRSRRYEGDLQYDAIVPRDKFTVFGWFKTPVGENTTFAPDDRPYNQASLPGYIQIGSYYRNPSLTVMRWYSLSSTTLYFKDENDSGWTSTKSHSVDYGAHEWLFIAVTWDGTQFGYYIGRPETNTWHAATQTNVGDGFGIGDTLKLKVMRGIGGWADDVAVVHRAMPESELRAIFESNAPVFAETSTWQFRATPTGLVWADDEGLWVRDENGNAVLGVYGGAEGGKSWGGATLDTGDLFIGHGSQFVQWDASAGQLHVSGVVDILAGSDGYDNLGDRPVDGATGLIIRASSASSAGLYVGADRLGYWDGTWWRAYFDNAGNFYLSGSTGDNYLEWSAASDTLIAAGWTFDVDRIVGGDTVLHKDGWAQFGPPNERVTIDPTDADWRLWIGHDNPTYANFLVSKNGALYATGADIAGKITADDGEIGGWTITASALVSGGMKLDSANKKIYWSATASISENAYGELYAPEGFAAGSHIYAPEIKATLLLWATGDARVDGELEHKGSTLGFFGVTPITRPGPGTNMKDSLIQLGLLKDGYYNLDLEGGDLLADDVIANDLVQAANVEVNSTLWINGVVKSTGTPTVQNDWHVSGEMKADVVKADSMYYIGSQNGATQNITIGSVTLHFVAGLFVGTS